MGKNGFQLRGRALKSGYDWWWHSFVGENEKTGEKRPFFIEYYVINPGLWRGKIEYGQLVRNKEEGIKPCYAMIKAGSWGEKKAQIHNFFGIDQFAASRSVLDCKIGRNLVTETKLEGSVNVSKEESNEFPERMTDAGEMSWQLQLNKKLSYNVGYGSSSLFNLLRLFRMYWHVGGMVCEFEGCVEYLGEKYIVKPETSYGYQDKNWGKDYTNPWIWLNCNNFISAATNEKVDASLDIGGGCPVVAGIPLKRKILTAFYYKGSLIEFNFSKFWKSTRQTFKSWEDEENIYWDITSESKKWRLEVSFRCAKSQMLLVHYENPAGEKNHHKLWNGGHASGTVKLFHKGRTESLVDELVGTYGGCEYGEY